MKGKRREGQPGRLRSLPKVEILTRVVPVATTFRSRLLGLAMLRPERAGDGLLIPRCRSVHTFGMRFDLCVVFLDATGRVVDEHPRVGANRIVSCANAASVLEVPCAAAIGGAR